MIYVKQNHKYFLLHNAMPDFMRGSEFYCSAKKTAPKVFLIPQMLLLLLL